MESIQEYCCKSSFSVKAIQWNGDLSIMDQISKDFKVCVKYHCGEHLILVKGSTEGLSSMSYCVRLSQYIVEDGNFIKIMNQKDFEYQYEPAKKPAIQHGKCACSVNVNIDAAQLAAIVSKVLADTTKSQLNSICGR
jgi:hypothetical protein